MPSELTAAERTIDRIDGWWKLLGLTDDADTYGRTQAEVDLLVILGVSRTLLAEVRSLRGRLQESLDRQMRLEASDRRGDG